MFERADKTGERITLWLVERRLAELAGHPPDCRCNIWRAAGRVTARAVHWIAANWQNQVAVTRRRATALAGVAKTD